MEENASTDQHRQTVNRRQVLKTTGAAATGMVLTSQTAGARPPAGGSEPATTSRLKASSSISETDISIPSWDGTTLETTLFTPAGTGPFPVVLMTHGWGSTRSSPLVKPVARNYAEHGYAVLTYDSRGFGGSSGTVTLNGENEVKDAQYLITWLANRPEIATEGADNPWLGMDGVSYAGGIQYLVEAVDDRLDAMVPRITWNDMEHSLAPDGVIKIGWLSALFGLGTFNTLLNSDADMTDDLSDWYWYAISNNDVPSDASEAFEERSVAHVDSIDTPTFLIQGWNDSLFTPGEALSTYDQLIDSGTEARLCFYEGGHDISEVTVSFENRQRMNDHAVAWMNRHVLDGTVDIPDIQEYLPQREEWREDYAWPPADVRTETYEFGVANQESEATLEPSGWFGFGGNESVVFEWTVDEPIEVVGRPGIDLSVDVTGPEERLFVQLEHDGSSINGQTATARLDAPGSHDIHVDYPAIQRFIGGGDTLTLTVSISNTWYLDSRESEATTLSVQDCRLFLPERPDPDGEDDEDEEDDEDDDCWWFC